MELFKYNRKSQKWYNKIDYIKLLFIFLITMVLFTLFFYYIGGSSDLDNALFVSFVVAFFLSLWSIFYDFYENRCCVFKDDGKELTYIDLHTDRSGKYLRDIDYWRILEDNMEEVFKDNCKFEGIDKGIIKKVISIKKKSNKMIVKANVEAKEWKSSGIILVSKTYIVDKEYTKKFIIPVDYENYNKLYKLLNKLK